MNKGFVKMAKFNQNMRTIANTMNGSLNHVRKVAMNGKDIRLAGGLRPNRDMGTNKVGNKRW